MSSKPEASDNDAATKALGSFRMSGLWYTPTAGEIDQVRAYLDEIEASINLLPKLTPEVDILDVGYDPSWTEVAE